MNGQIEICFPEKKKVNEILLIKKNNNFVLLINQLILRWYSHKWKHTEGSKREGGATYAIKGWYGCLFGWLSCRLVALRKLDFLSPDTIIA